MATRKTPIIPLTDPNFKYTSSVSTDVAKTFERARKKQREAQDMTTWLEEFQRMSAEDLGRMLGE